MSNRFDTTSAGCHYTPGYLVSLSDEELAAALREENDGDLLRDLLYRADLLDEYDAMDEHEQEMHGWDLIYKAADILGVEID